MRLLINTDASWIPYNLHGKIYLGDPSYRLIRPLLCNNGSLQNRTPSTLLVYRRRFPLPCTVNYYLKFSAVWTSLAILQRSYFRVIEDYNICSTLFDEMRVLLSGKIQIYIYDVDLIFVTETLIGVLFDLLKICFWECINFENIFTSVRR